MNKALLVAIAATSLFACGGKKKSADSSGSGSAAPASGSAGATADTGTAGGTGSGGALWTDAPDPLQQAVLDSVPADAVKISKKDPSIIGQLIDAAAAAHASAARDAWDPAAVVAAVGKDRVSLFKWVRDNTALVPYRGSLRGSVGVMMDRVGNSLDRALLLADVLGKAGLEVRLANAQLSPDLVATLVAAAKTRARPALSTAHLDDAALVASFAKIIGGDATALGTVAAKQRAAQDALLARTQTRVASQAKALATLVPASGAQVSTDDAYTDHWWVQVHDGDAWTDLDPSLPTASPGEALAATATETLLPADLGDERQHRLSIRVIGEVWQGDKRQEAVLVDHAFAPSQFFGQRISVTNIAMDMPDEKAMLAAPDKIDFLAKALVKQHEFTPVIMVGNAPVVHFSVNDRGELTDLANGYATEFGLGRSVQHATQDGVGGATGLLDQMPGPDGSGSAPPATPPAEKPPALTAEWLEVEIQTPGSAPRIVRRTLFDSLGPVGDRDAAHPAVLSEAARLDRAYALIGDVELLPMFAQIPDAFVIDRNLTSLVAARDVLIGIASGKSVDELKDKASGVTASPGPIYKLALARFADPSIYLDKLDVLAVRRRLVVRDKGVVVRTLSDILANSVAVWPTNTDPRGARIAQGIRDTDLEVLATPCPRGVTCSRSPSTAEQFAASGKDWRVNATPAGPAALDRRAGYAVVAPNAAPQTWWRVDPVTGETLGMGPFGGQEMTEEAIKQSVAQQYYVAVVNFVFCLIQHHSQAGQLGALGGCVFTAAVGGVAGQLAVLAQNADWAIILSTALSNSLNLAI